MANQRFAAPIIQLPQDWESGRRAIEVLLTQLVTPSLLRVHEIDFVNVIRAGATGGAYLPVGALYVDENNTVKMVADNQQWIMPTELVLRGGSVTAI